MSSHISISSLLKKFDNLKIDNFYNNDDKSNILISHFDTPFNLTFIGQGSFGCVYTPALYSNDELYVSKLFTSKSEREYENLSLKHIHNMDPISIFTLKTQDIYVKYKNKNKYKYTVLNKHLNVDKYCSLFKTIPHTIPFINIENGGKNLNHISSIDFSLFWTQFFNLLQGIINMNKISVHRDVKEYNLLFSPSKISLIDFGLQTSKKYVFDRKSIDRLSIGYPYYPPEFSLSAFMLENLSSSDDINTFIHNIESFQLYKSFDTLDIFQHYCEICFRNIHYYYDFQFFQNNSSLIQNDIFSFLFTLKDKIKKIRHTFRNNKNISIDYIIHQIFDKYTNRIDVYSLGMTFIFIVSKILKNSSTLSPFDNIHFEIFSHLLTFMTRPDPFQRIHPDKLLSLIRILKNIQYQDTKNLQSFLSYIQNIPSDYSFSLQHLRSHFQYGGISNIQKLHKHTFNSQKNDKKLLQSFKTTNMDNTNLIFNKILDNKPVFNKSQFHTQKLPIKERLHNLSQIVSDFDKAKKSTKPKTI